jgi:3-deoxy-D-manno-octulosonic-acid transferase
MYFLYSFVLALAVLLSSPWWLLRILRHDKYREGLGERLGFTPQRIQFGDDRPAIWVHAVSVGEVLAISGLVQRLYTQSTERRIVISTTTKTGQELARSRFGEENVFYFPLDFALCIRPYLKVLRPELVVIAETEFWPNFLRLAKASGARIAVVNARISDRSYPRYRRWRELLRHVLTNIDVFCAQTKEDSRRLCEIGAPAGRVHVAGNLKFDLQPPDALPLVAQLRAAIHAGGAEPVIVAGSTVEGEEEGLLREFKRLVETELATALLILAPRHPERFGQVMAQVARAGLPLARRSEWSGSPLSGGVFLLDSIGELAALYELADVAIVGGSFAAHGGHNILEPAWCGKPIIIGRHYENFRDIVEQFMRAEAVVINENPIRAAAALLRDSTRAQELGRRARAVLDANSGATNRTLEHLGRLIRTAYHPEPHEVA